MIRHIMLVTALVLGLVPSSQTVFADSQSAREQFIAHCMTKVATRPHQSADVVCACLHDNAILTIDDADMRAAIMRNIEDNGKPGISAALVPLEKRGQIDATLTQLARPALACMYDGVH